MMDIVDRLRRHAIRGDSPIADEAADEIERLRDAFGDIKHYLQTPYHDRYVIEFKIDNALKGKR